MASEAKLFCRVSADDGMSSSGDVSGRAGAWRTRVPAARALLFARDDAAACWLGRSGRPRSSDSRGRPGRCWKLVLQTAPTRWQRRQHGNAPADLWVVGGWSAPTAGRSQRTFWYRQRSQASRRSWSSTSRSAVSSGLKSIATLVVRSGNFYFVGTSIESSQTRTERVVTGTDKSSTGFLNMLQLSTAV